MCFVLAGRVEFRLERRDLQLECLVLFHPAAEESRGKCQFFCNPHGREEIHVLKLIFTVLKVLHIHKALVEKGFVAVVQPAQAHAELHSQLAFRQIEVFLQDAHDPKMLVFLDLGLTACHWDSFKVVLKQTKMCFGQTTAVPSCRWQRNFIVSYSVKVKDSY